MPGSIPGPAGSYFVLYLWEICEEFGTCLGHIFGDLSDISGRFSDMFCFSSDMCGNVLGTFWDHLG